MNQNINKEFEDKSWDAMRTLLDHEMPEGGLLIPPISAAPTVSADNRKQRWFLPFFILTTCLVGGFSWYYFSTPISPILETKVSVDKNVVEKGQNIEERNPDSIGTKGAGIENSPSFTVENKVSNGIKTVKTGQNIEERNPDSIGTEGVVVENPPSFAVETNISKDINTVKTGQNTEEKNFNIIAKSENPKPISNEINESQTTDNQVIKSDVLQVDKNEIALEMAEKPIRQTNNLPYAFLPLAKAFVFNIRDTNVKINAPLPLVKIVNPSKSLPLAWGITSGVHTEGGKKLDGFQTGLFLSKKIGRKWAIHTGLTYRRNTAQGDSMTFVQLNANAIGITSPTSSTSSSFSLAQGREIKLKNLNYLELPVTVHCRFSKKFSAFLGIKVAYLLSNSIITGDNSKLYVVESARDQANKVSFNTYVQGSTTQSLGLKRWDGAMIGGISYNVLPKMIVSVRYDFGLKNILNQQNWKAYNRYLGLNLNYNF